MGEVTRYCPACYAPNPAREGSCLRCGATLVSEEAIDERLVWALRHPDTQVAMLAAELLAARGARRAVPALLRMTEEREPYRAAAAARALGAFVDEPRVALALRRLADGPSFLVREAAGAALARGSEPGSVDAGQEGAPTRAEVAGPGLVADRRERSGSGR